MPKHEIESYSIAECNAKLLDFRKKSIRSSEIICLIARRVLELDPQFDKISDKHAALEGWLGEKIFEKNGASAEYFSSNPPDYQPFSFP